MTTDVLIVGAGFAGSIIAERAASAGKSVLVVDRRSHIGGNAFDEFDKDGVLVHRYGPHIFHTNAPRVVEYLSRFTEWIPYEHRVLAEVDDELYPVPINRTTVNRLYGLGLDEEGVKHFFEGVRENRMPVRTSEDAVLNSVGQDLCDKFFRNYTRKQWGLELSDLAASVAARIPTRINDDDRYFTDDFQKMPAEGFTRLFERMLDHPKITVLLNQDFESLRNNVTYGKLFYSGAIDEYFHFQYGRLAYRSLRFEHEHLRETKQYQPVGTVNYPNRNAFTRITEFKHLTGQHHQGTSIVREYPEADGDPYYPVPRPENQALYDQYAALAKDLKEVYFIGRLGQYKYFNMDQVVAQALSVAEKAGFGPYDSLAPAGEPLV